MAEGLGEGFQIEAEEMYGEFFDIPEPDRLVLVSWFQGGEVFRSSPGHLERRAVGRATRRQRVTFGNGTQPLEPISR